MLLFFLVLFLQLYSPELDCLFRNCIEPLGFGYTSLFMTRLVLNSWYSCDFKEVEQLTFRGSSTNSVLHSLSQFVTIMALFLAPYFKKREKEKK